MPPQGLRLRGLDLSKPTDLHNPRKAATQELTPEQKAQYEAEMKKYWEDYDKANPVSGFLRGTLEGFGGASSLDDPTKPATSSDYGKGAADVLQSGLPFGAFIKGLRGGKLYHGTPKIDRLAKEGFRPEFHNKADTLGWMTHFAEDPVYAQRYADKGGRYVDAQRQGMTAVTLDADNVLDLYNVNDEDFNKLKSAANPVNYQYLKGLTPVQKKNAIIHDDDWSGIKTYNREVPTQLTDFLNRMTPEEFNKLGFDAVRYPDVGYTTGVHEPSWGVPDPKKIRNAYTGEIMHGLGESEEKFRKRIIDAHGEAKAKEFFKNSGTSPIDWSNSKNWNITPTEPKKVSKSSEPKKFFMGSQDKDKDFKNYLKSPEGKYSDIEYIDETGLWMAKTDPPTYHTTPEEAMEFTNKAAEPKKYYMTPEGNKTTTPQYLTGKDAQDAADWEAYYKNASEAYPDEVDSDMEGVKKLVDKYNKNIEKHGGVVPPVKPYEPSEVEKAAQKEHDQWMANWEKENPTPTPEQMPGYDDDEEAAKKWIAAWKSKKNDPVPPDPFWETKNAVDDKWDKFWKQHSLSDPAKKPFKNMNLKETTDYLKKKK